MAVKKTTTAKPKASTKKKIGSSRASSKTKTTSPESGAKRATKSKKTAAKKPVAKKQTSKTKSVKKTSSAIKKPTTPLAKKVLTDHPDEKLYPNAAKLDDLIEELGELMKDFMDAADIHGNLTPKERQRLISAGVRNYGFIEKTYDIVMDNRNFEPPNFDVVAFKNNLYEFDQIRQFYFLAEKLQTIASDSMLIKSNVLYRESLRVYNSLKEQARAGIAGARDLFNALEPFFRRRRNPESPPTKKQEERKSRSLLNGRTEGEMLIKNVNPKKTAGIHQVEEIELKDDIKYKETDEGEIKE